MVDITPLKAKKRPCKLAVVKYKRASKWSFPMTVIWSIISLSLHQFSMCESLEKHVPSMTVNPSILAPLSARRCRLYVKSRFFNGNWFWVFTLLNHCSSQPSIVHWLSSPIFPCSVVCSFVPPWWHLTKSHFYLPHTPKPIHFLKAYDNSYSKMN